MSSRLRDDEIDDLKSAQTSDEWDDICAKIRSIRDGDWPEDWWQRVIQSGIYTRARARWGLTS